MSSRQAQHGSRGRYNAGCRCDRCRAANSRYLKRWRCGLTEGPVDATGTARRLQALHAAGWSWRDLGVRLGTSPQWPAGLARVASPSVTRVTEGKVRALYAALETTPGPSVRARTWAAKRGWLGPAWWDESTLDDPSHDPLADTAVPDEHHVDEVLVARVHAGKARFAALNDAERVALMRLHARSDEPAVHFAARVGLAGTTFKRLRARAAELERSAA